MPNSRAVYDLAAKIESIGVAAQQAQHKAVMRASLILKDSINAQLTNAIGGDHRMSNLRKRSGQTPPTLKVGFDIKGKDNIVSLLYARGPWGLVEYGAMPHTITPRLAALSSTGKGMSRATRKRAITQRRLDIAYGASSIFAGVSPLNLGGRHRYRVQHPGTRGKMPFHKGMDKARAQAIQELHTVIKSTVVDVIRSGRQVYVYSRGGM